MKALPTDSPWSHKLTASQPPRQQLSSPPCARAHGLLSHSAAAPQAPPPLCGAPVLPVAVPDVAVPPPAPAKGVPLSCDSQAVLCPCCHVGDPPALHLPPRLSTDRGLPAGVLPAVLVLLQACCAGGLRGLETNPRTGAGLACLARLHSLAPPSVGVAAQYNESVELHVTPLDLTLDAGFRRRGMADQHSSHPPAHVFGACSQDQFGAYKHFHKLTAKLSASL